MYKKNPKNIRLFRFRLQIWLLVSDTGNIEDPHVNSVLLEKNQSVILQQILAHLEAMLVVCRFFSCNTINFYFMCNLILLIYFIINMILKNFL